MKILQFTEKAKVSEWVAHDNAIFDVCWIKVRLSSLDFRSYFIH